MTEHEVSKKPENRLLEYLNKLRLDDRLTDFTICIDKESLKVHKIVLEANSDYFKAMLTSESTEEIKNGQVTLEDIDLEAVKIIVDFWYTGKMEMTGEIICSLLLATSRFQANEALEMCTKFAETNLTAANCLSIVLIAERCNLVDLFEKAFIYCLKHFDSIIEDTEILSIDEELLTKIISDDRLHVSDEIHVFVLVIRWIEFDEKSRSSSLDKLMSQVRYASIDLESLFEPSIMNLINSSAKYRIPYERAKNILLLKDHPGLLRQHAGVFQSSPRRSESSVNPRLDVPSANSRLYVFAGSSTGMRSHYVYPVEVYDPWANQWRELGDTPTRITQNHAVAIAKNCVYAFTDDEDHFRVSTYYNSDTNHWSRGAGKIITSVIDGFLVALNEYIYFFGGGFFVRDITRYHLSRDDMKFCTSMRGPRVKPGFVVHDHYIYVMGGTRPNSSLLAMRTVERYDTRQDKWESVASMKHSRMSFSCCSYNGKIYVAGGSDGVQVMNQAEVYDPKLDTWTEIAPMNCSRTDFGLAELSGQIYAVGGFDGNDTTNLVEAYNPDKNTWVRKNGLRNKRRGHSVLVLDKCR